MTQYKLTKIGPDGAELPDDATGHEVVKIEHDSFAAPIYVTAHVSPNGMMWGQAKEWAAGLTLNGWKWRLPTVEEAFLIVDRSRTDIPALDPEFFPGNNGDWIWTETADAQPPRGPCVARLSRPRRFRPVSPGYSVSCSGRPRQSGWWAMIVRECPFCGMAFFTRYAQNLMIPDHMRRCGNEHCAGGRQEGMIISLNEDELRGDLGAVETAPTDANGSPV